MFFTLYTLLCDFWQYFVARLSSYAPPRPHQSPPKEPPGDLEQGKCLKQEHNEQNRDVSSDPRWAQDYDNLVSPPSSLDGSVWSLRLESPPCRSSPYKGSRMKISGLINGRRRVYTIMRTCGLFNTLEAYPVLPIVQGDLSSPSPGETVSGSDLSAELNGDGPPKLGDDSVTLAPVKKPKRKRPSTIVWFSKFQRSTVLELRSEHPSRNSVHWIEVDPTSRSLDAITVTSNDKGVDVIESAHTMALVLQALSMNEETDDGGEGLRRRLARESEWTIGRSLGFNSQVSLQHTSLGTGDSCDLGSRVSLSLHHQILSRREPTQSSRESLLSQSTSSELPYLQPRTLCASTGLGISGLTLAIRDDTLRTLEARMFGMSWGNTSPAGHDMKSSLVGGIADDDYEWEAVSESSSSSWD